MREAVGVSVVGLVEDRLSLGQERRGPPEVDVSAGVEHRDSRVAMLVVVPRDERPAVVGRLGLFLGSDQGALANTTFVSLTASCQLHGIEPWAYLHDLFCLLPGWKRSRVLEFVPLYWNETLQPEQTQQRLAANPFRPSDRSHSARSVDIGTKRRPIRALRQQRGSSNGYPGLLHES